MYIYIYIHIYIYIKQKNQIYIHKNICIWRLCCVYMTTKQFSVHACNNIGKPVLFQTRWHAL